MKHSARLIAARFFMRNALMVLLVSVFIPAVCIADSDSIPTTSHHTIVSKTLVSASWYNVAIDETEEESENEIYGDDSFSLPDWHFQSFHFSSPYGISFTSSYTVPAVFTTKHPLLSRICVLII